MTFPTFTFPAANACLLALFAWNIVLFVHAIRGGFTRPNGTPPLMRLLTTVGALSVAADVWAIATAGPIPVMRLFIGVVLLGASQSLFHSASRATEARRLSLAFSTDLPAHLNDAGPYRLVRHPFYLAYIVTWSAVALTSQHPAAFTALFVTTLLYALAALREERKFLRSPMAAAYRAYQRRVGMFVPRIFRTHQPT